MNKNQIIKAFEALNSKLSEMGIKGEIGVVGGAAMVLAFNARAATKDVDAIFEPSSKIRSAAKSVAEKLDLPEDWINDAVKGYLPGTPKKRSVLLSLDHLTVWVPETEYLFAMKSISARFDSSDGADIKTLVKELELKSVDRALQIVEQYYPKKQIPPKTRFFLEELFDSM